MKKWMIAFMAPVLPALLGGCMAHSTPSVPLHEISAHTPDMLRQLLSGRVRVWEYGPGRQFAGDLVAWLASGDGTWRSCGIASGKSYSGRWTVAPDARGRATYSSTSDGRATARRTYVVHYDPATGDLNLRRPGSGTAWVTVSSGWLQERWPQVAVDRCPGLNLRGLGVDKRQTGTSLAVLRRQAPDAPLKGLVQPLPRPMGKQGAATGGGADPLSKLTDELVAGGKERALPFMGQAYADRRFVFIGDGHLVVVDRDGNLAAGEGFEGNWRWAEGRLELRVAGDARVHSIAWRDLAKELGMAASAAGG